MNDSLKPSNICPTTNVDFTSKNLVHSTVLLNKSRFLLGTFLCQDPFVVTQSTFLGHLESNISNTPPPRIIIIPCKDELRIQRATWSYTVIPPINGRFKKWAPGVMTLLVRSLFQPTYNWIRDPTKHMRFITCVHPLDFCHHESLM